MGAIKHFYASLNFFSLFIYGLIIAMVGPILDVLQKDFQVNAGMIGLLFTGLSIGFIISVFSGIVLIRSHSMPRIHRYGQIAILIGLTGVALSPVFFFSAISFLFIGMGGGLIQIAVNGHTPQLYPDHRGAALNVLHLFFGLGAFIGPFYAAHLYALKQDWRILFFVVGSLSLLQNILLFFAYGRFSRYKKDKDLLPNAQRLGNPQFSKVLSYGYIYLLIFAVILYVGVEMGLTAWIVLYMQESSSMDRTNASAYLSYFWLAITLGRLFVAYFNRFVSSEIVLVLLIMIGTVSQYFFMQNTHPVILGILIFIMGLGFSAIFTSLMHLGTEVFPNNIPATSNILLIALGIGLLLFPWFVGLIKQVFSLPGGFYFMLGSFVVLFAVAIVIGKQYRKYQKNGVIL